MTSAERGGERDHERCSRCDPGLLDELKCQATGIQAQAAYNAEHKAELDKARDAFKTARTDYNSARSDAIPKVDKAREDLEGLHDRVRCLLDREDAECIDIAFGRVVEQLDRCGHGRGCCCDGDCDYDDIRDCDPDDVPGRKAVIEKRTKEAQKCFWTLIGEYTVVTTEPAPSGEAPAGTAGTAPATPAGTAPAAATPAAPAPATTSAPAPVSASATSAASAADAAAPAPADDAALAALPARVKALQDEIDKISKAAADGSWEPAKLYAAVLVARRHLKDVWDGFADVNEYMECLCQALTCTVKGHAAIGELTRQEAVHQCYRDSWKNACEHLAQYTVEEVLAEYLRVCEPCDEDRPERGRRRHRDHDGDGHRDRNDDRDDDGHRDDDRDREGDAGRNGERGRDDDRDRDRRRGRDDNDRDDDRDGDGGGRDHDGRGRNHDDDRGDDRAEQRPSRYRDARGRYRAP